MMRLPDREARKYAFEWGFFMQCPRSDGTLKEVTIDGVTIDICESCGGVWFDAQELAKFDEAHEESGQELLTLMAQYHSDGLDHAGPLKSPKDPSVTLVRRYYSPKEEIEIDECPITGSIWLDAGELAKIRELFPSQEDRKRAYRDFAVRFKRSADIEKMKRESGSGRTERVMGLFEWIFGR